MVSYQWHKVLSKEDADKYPLNSITHRNVDGKCIALLRFDDGFFILDNYCPHKGGPLAQGKLDDQGYLVCPWHKYQYNPRTGQSPPDFDDPPAKHYRNELREDGLYVSFPSKD